MDKEKILTESKAWVEQFVIGHGLCPFAKVPYFKGQVRFHVANGKGLEGVLIDFWKEVELLDNSPQSELSNSILILPEGLEDFEKYLDLFDLAERLLADQQKEATYQLASFHPDYQFEGTNSNAVSNFTNRSPYPFIHILRTEEVEQAIENYPEIDDVPKRNIETMERVFGEKKN